MDQTQRPVETRRGSSPIRSRRRFLAGTACWRARAALAACTPAAAPSVAEQAGTAASEPAIRRTQRAATFTLERPLKVLLANHTGFYAMVTPEWEQRTGAKVEFTREAFGPFRSS